MMSKKIIRTWLFFLELILIISVTILNSNLSVAGNKSFSVDDAMKFKVIKSPVISDDGEWVAYYTEPDRGDPQAIVSFTDTTKPFNKYTIDRGTNPKFTNDSKWIGFTVQPKDIEELNADKDKKPKTGMALLNLENGEKKNFENINRYVFSEDSKWLAYVINSDKKPADKSDKKDLKITGNDIVLRNLTAGSELPIQNVTEFVFDTLANYFVYTVATADGKRNGIYYIKLQGLFNLPQQLIQGEKQLYSSLAWNNEQSLLAFISGKEDYEGKADSCALMIWDSRMKELSTILKSKDTTDKAAPNGWLIPFKNKLQWTEDGNRLFFGLKPINDTTEKVKEVKFNDTNFYNIDSILQKREMDLWHWNDPRIKTNQKIWWKENKDRTFLAVYSTESKKWLQLADENLPEVMFTDNPKNTVGFDDTPYLKEITWSGTYQDIYSVNLISGARKKIAEKLSENARISPNGNYIVYFNKNHWYSYNCNTDTTINMTDIIKEVPFYDVEYDEPADAPSYGFGGWVENDQAVLLYDQYDIWKFYPDPDNGYLNITAAAGRTKKVTYRIINLDRDKKFFEKREDIIITGYDDVNKTQGLYRINLAILGPDRIVHEDNKINVISKAKGTFKLLYTKQKYELFPDLWVSDSTFSYQRQVSDIHPEIKDYNWGKSELVRWVNSSGDSLTGWVIKPEGMDSKKKYPMLVYFYDRFSDYYNTFFSPKMNHRPCYPIYTGKDYVIFHPDIVYKPGNPGYDATDCIVSGVRSVLKEGYVDSNAIGIQGHSWGGYQTAFIITQTNLFAAAVAGAPVGNMTSAYSGIRYGTGLARQFQYEKAQSRIGGTLWDSLQNYIRNSPIFQADKIKTPFMLMFGDDDWAVPWTQGIEIYLDMRRLNKNCVFLQYRGEPHWPEKYPNRLDYAIKMQEFFDHYLLGKPAPEWLTKGVEYKGK